MFQSGVITSTLYELFQAVFKLRQEAANQKRKQANNQSTTKANNAAVSNGTVTYMDYIPSWENVSIDWEKAFLGALFIFLLPNCKV